MARLGAIFVGLCMALIAGSLGALMYLYVGTSGAESAIVTLVAFTGLAVYNAVALKVHDRADAAGPVADLSRGTADLARQVLDLGRRVATMESRLDGVLDRVGEAAKPLSDELSELASLLTQVAETVATHDTLLRSGEPGSPYAAPRHGAAEGATAAATRVATTAPAAAAAAATTAATTGATTAGRDGPVVPGGIYAGLSLGSAAELVREALEANRIDLMLQPIVMLPQRKVRYYEAVARLRSRTGETVMPADFLPIAEATGQIARLDNAMLFRAVQIARRLLGKNREVGLFCNVSAATLVDPEFFPQFNEFADANRALSPAFVFEFRQDAYRSLGPMENESLAALSERGFRFSLDHVGDMRLEPRDLADRGFRFVKVPAALLLSRHSAPPTDIHPADLAGLLGRYGIELIAERIETESAVVDLLDYDVKLGQGFLFSPPRSVRPEVLQGLPERGGDLAGAFDRPAPAPARPAPGQGIPSRPAQAPAGPASAAPTSLAAALGLRPAVAPVVAPAAAPVVAPVVASVVAPAAVAGGSPAAVAAATGKPPDPPLAAVVAQSTVASVVPPAAAAPAGAPSTPALPATPTATSVAATPAATPGAPAAAAPRRPAAAQPGTVLAQIARGMLARK